MTPHAFMVQLLNTDASWWRSHVALPAIIREHIGEPARGVEVGVAYGSGLVWLARQFPNAQLYGVDSFMPYDPADGMSDAMIAGDEIAKFVLYRLEVERANATLIRNTSVQAARAFQTGSLDFVYIDADHRYDAVRTDIASWLPKIRSGGLICGHDYCEEWPDVVRAVNASFQSPTVYAASTIWAVRVP